MLTVVVARYAEDVSWINALPRAARVYVYNKGDAILPSLSHPSVTVHRLDNSGRESGTYLHHLKHAADPRESEFTVFTQGDPFQHSPRFHDLIARRHLWADIQPLSNQFKQERLIPPPEVIEADKREWIEDISVRAERFSLHTLAPCSYWNAPAWNIGHIYRTLHQLSPATNVAAHFLLRCGLKSLAEQAVTGDLGFQAYGAIFAVHNRRLSQRLSALAPHIGTMESVAHQAEPLAPRWWNYGHLFEVLWLHIFGAPFIRIPSLRSQAVGCSAPDSDVSPEDDHRRH